MKGAVLLAAAVACSGGARSTPEGSREPVSLVLEEVDGGQVTLASFRGRTVIVHFFATWSLAAMADVEELRAVKKRFHEVEIVGIGLDPDGAKLLSPWREAVDADWWIVLPGAEVTAGDTPFGKITTVPATFVLDDRGRIHWAKGAQLAPGELLPIVRTLEDGGRGP